jgi:hypothetical protein
VRIFIILIIAISSLFTFTAFSNAESKYKLFYSNEDTSDVVGIETTISINTTSREELYSLLFYKLKEDPQNPNLHQSVPDSIQLKHMTLHENGTLDLDFNEEVMNLGSRSSEFIFIKSVNYTLFSNFPEIKHIYYTVEGNRLHSLSHIDISEGFSRNNMK